MKIKIKKIDHIQICIPEGQETIGREFYCGILGMEEIEKPNTIKSNGGFWLQLNDFQIHIGIENITADSKRHTAFEVENLIKIKAYLKEKGVKIKEDQIIPGIYRFSILDPWKNRIEFLEKYE